ncbi:MAG: diaminopimelate decarboxylase [Dehalococcoidia bacterium]|nr:diaminopimelate decarboxylase [Dehalococcoidia bacterium]
MNSKLAVFPTSAEINPQGHLAIGGVDMVELAAHFGTPLYVFDEATLRARCREFKREFVSRYGNTAVVYAGKAFLHGALAVILRDEGLGLDVVSAGELHIAINAGFPPGDIYFHGNNKSRDELTLALRHNVGRIVVDNMNELDMLIRLAEEGGYTPKIFFRIMPGVDAHTHGHLTTGAADSKFGIPLSRAEEAVAKAMASAPLKLVGLHFHIGSMVGEHQPYLAAMDRVLGFSAEMTRKYGFDLQELDIGGGFGVQYTLDSPMPEVSFFAERLTGHLSAHYKSLNQPLPQLIIEPGRAVVAQAGVALYTAGTIKEVGGRLYVAVDGGMADNIRPPLYDARYEVLSAGKADVAEADEVTVVGRYCETGDILIKDTRVAPVVAGDILAVPVCGAYCLPMASNYNAALRPAVVMVGDGSARLIRRRESLEDLTHCDSI